MMRLLVCCFLGFLLWPLPTLAGDVLFRFDYDLARYPGVSFALRLSMWQGTRPILEERVATPVLTPAQCRPLGTGDFFETLTPQTLCVQLCLDPGEYSITVYAFRDGQRSLESNVVDLSLTSGTPCHASGKEPPQKKIDPTTIALTGAGTVATAGLTWAAIEASQSSEASLPELVNRTCVHPKVIPGGCLCGWPPHPCASVTYWEPGWIVETVKKPGTSALPFLGKLLDVAVSSLGAPPLGGGGSVTATSQTNLHFSEAHVYEFPQLLGGPCTFCGPSGGLALNYASELDPGWRVHPPASGLLGHIVNVGVWGRLFPRAGWAIHGSPVVASGLNVMRALSIAAMPASIEPADAHVIVKPTDGVSTCLQPAAPRQKPCFTAGTPSMLWEAGSLSLKGTYVWVAWRQRTCCVEIAQAYCGLTLPGLGQTGQNGCLLPSLTPP